MNPFKILFSGKGNSAKSSETVSSHEMKTEAVTPPVAPAKTKSAKGQSRQSPISQSNAAAVLSGYEALSNNGDRQKVQVVAAYRQFLDGLSRQQLVLLSRYIYENYSTVGYTVWQLVKYSADITVKAASKDKEWNKLAEKYFKKWAKGADFYRINDLTELLDNWQTAKVVDGDVGFIVVYDELGIPRIQTIDSLSINSFRAKDLSKENKIHDGVVTDSYGRVTGYCVEVEPGKYQIIPQNHCFLIRDFDFTKKYRSSPRMRRGLNDIRDARETIGYEKKGQKSGASIAGTISSDNAIEEDDNPLNEDASDEAASSTSFKTVEILSSQFVIGQNGVKIEPFKNERNTPETVEFIKFLIASYINSSYLPSSFIDDEKLTGPGTRSVGGKAQKTFDAEQSQLCKALEFIWVRVIADAIAKGYLKPVDDWDEINYVYPREYTIDIGREQAQDRADVINRLQSRRSNYSRRGLDPDAEDKAIHDEIKADYEKAMELHKDGCPLDLALARYGFTTAAEKNTPGYDEPSTEKGKEDDEQNDDE